MKKKVTSTSHTDTAIYSILESTQLQTWKTDQWLTRVSVRRGRKVTVVTKDTYKDLVSNANATILTRSLTLWTTALQACKLSTMHI